MEVRRVNASLEPGDAAHALVLVIYFVSLTAAFVVLLPHFTLLPGDTADAPNMVTPLAQRRRRAAWSARARERRASRIDGATTAASSAAERPHRSLSRKGSFSSQIEKRISEDGFYYTYDEFVAHYGGRIQWDAARQRKLKHRRPSFGLISP